MLSGGMDSGSVVAVAAPLLAESGRGPLPTFSAVGPDPETCIEARTIRAAMTSPGITPHSVNHADMGPWKDDLLRLAMAVDEPFDAHMNLVRAVYLAAQRAGCKVMLDGAAGDVVLSHGTQIAQLLRSGRWLQAVRDAVGEERFWGPSWPARQTLVQSVRTAFVPQWLRRALYFARRNRRAPKAADGGLIAPAFALRIDFAGRKASLLQPPPHRWPSYAEERARSIAGNSLLVGRERYDRVAAALAIKPRDPFMDLRLVRHCLRLPGAHLERDGCPKMILRRAMAERLPKTVRWRTGKEHLGWTFTRTLFANWAVCCDADLGARQIPSEYASHEKPFGHLFADNDKLGHLRVLDECLARSLTVGEFEAATLTEWLSDAFQHSPNRKGLM